MSKKRTGLLIAFGAAMGAAAACVSYYLKYKSFNDELDRDFHDYEEDDSFDLDEEKKETPAGEDGAKRTYIPIDGGKASAHEEQVREESGKMSGEEPAPAPEAEAKKTADVTVEEDTEGPKE